jgi:hypothetical protein
MNDRSSVGTDRVGRFAFVLAYGVLVLATSLQICATTGFLCGWSLSPLTILVSIIVSGVLTSCVFASRFGRRPLPLLGTLALLFGLIGLAAVVSGRFYDLSCDGQYYHQEAVVQLARGWNPVHRETALPPDNEGLWLEHYAKGPWILGASVYQVTGRIETAKCFNVLLILATFGFSLCGLLRQRLRPPLALAVAALAALNPVAVCQVFTFCVDGQMAAHLTILVALAFLSLGPRDTWTHVAVAMSVVSIVNVKFTGGPYAGVLVAAALVVISLRSGLRPARGLTMAAAVGLLVGVFVVGFNPYVANVIEHGHPFYPLAGKDAVDIMTESTPADLIPMNRLARLTTSLFSRSENAATPQVTHRKWPFSVDREEIDLVFIPDTRVAGFGPLFSGVVVLSALLLLGMWLTCPRAALQASAVAAVLVGSALLHDNAWWARYAPQLWLVPLLMAVISVQARGRVCLWLRTAVLLAAAANAGLVTWEHVRLQALASRSTRERLEELKRTAAPVWVDLGVFRSTGVRFTEAGLAYQVVPDPQHLPCATPIRLDNFDCSICPATGDVPR